jgi:hypothetical protein
MTQQMISRRSRASWARAAFASVALSSLLLASTAEAAPWKPGPLKTTPPTQAELDEASARYQKGTKLYDVEGDVSSALLELERAYDIAPNYAVLFNIGQVARTGRDYVTSLRAFQAFLQYGGSNVTPEKKAAVEAEIKTLKDLVATVKVTTNAKDGTLLIDDAEEGTLPLDGVMVNPGPHRFVLQSSTGTATKTMTVIGGETKPVELNIEAAKPVVGPQPKPQPDKVEPSGGSKAWIGWVVTGVIGAGAIATGSIALAQKSDINDTAYFGPTPPANLESEQKTATALGVTTDVLIGAAALSAGISLYFTIKDASDDGSDTKATATADGRDTIGIRVSPTGMSLSGSF